MNYKILGRPLTHDEMIEIAKSKEPRLYCIVGNKEVEPVHVRFISINLETKQWEFRFNEEEYFEDGELLFKTRRSAEIYLKRRNK